MKNDLRSAWRMLSKSPGLSAVAIAVLGVGLGACLMVFSWVQWLVLSPFPGVPGGSSLRVIAGRSAQGSLISLSALDYRDLAREGAPFFEAAALEMQAMSITVGAAPERIFGDVVSGNYFDLLRLRPQLGRFFLPDEDQVAGDRAVVVLSDALWRTRFAADPGIVGRTVQLNSRAFTVVGVAPADFLGTEVGLKLDVWVPLAMQEVVYPGQGRLTERGDRWLRCLVRLRDGVGPAAAGDFLRGFGARQAATYPKSNADLDFALLKLSEAPWGATQVMAPVMAVLAAMVLLVLLVTCANVASLLLVRGIGRRREFAVRRALGASRGRLVRLLTTESLLLAVLAAAVGIVAAVAVKGSIYRLFPPVPVPINTETPIGPVGYAAAAVLALFVAIAAGLAPALQAGREGIEAGLREGSGAVAGASKRRGRGRRTLVVVQMALCTVLLVSGALLLRAVRAGQAASPGFDSHDVLLAGINLFPNGYDRARGIALEEQLLDRLQADPMVEAAAIGRRLPLDLGGSSSAFLTIDGYTPPKGDDVLVRYNQVSRGYMKTMGIAVLAGREFDRADREGAPLSVVVNESMARRYWPGGSLDGALGGTFKWGEGKLAVVGIVRDIKTRDLGESPEPYFYLPLGQSFRHDGYVTVRTRGPALAFTPRLRALLAELDPNLAMFAVKSMEEHLQIALFKQRLAASTLTAFGLLALLLAGIGLYGLIAFAVGQRRRELGLRLALGALPRDVVRLVLGEGLRLAALGLAIGALAAVGVGRLLHGLLLGVSGTDAVALGGALVLVAAAVLLASYLPARRAGRLDPMVALRHDS